MNAGRIKVMNKGCIWRTHLWFLVTAMAEYSVERGKMWNGEHGMRNMEQKYDNARPDPISALEIWNRNMITQDLTPSLH
jgi:hypothetical protein